MAVVKRRVIDKRDGEFEWQLLRGGLINIGMESFSGSCYEEVY